MSNKDDPKPVVVRSMEQKTGHTARRVKTDSWPYRDKWEFCASGHTIRYSKGRWWKGGHTVNDKIVEKCPKS